MQQTNLTIWWYTFQFLSAFHSLQYDSVPIALLLLRDVQKYLLRQYKHLPKVLLNQEISTRIQTECIPYLIHSKPDKSRTGYTLIRSNMYRLTEGIKDEPFIYLAHHKKEYLQVKSQMGSRLFFYIHHLPERRIPFSEEKKLYQALDQIFSRSSIHSFFQRKEFQVWLKRKIAITLIWIRKIDGLFQRFPIIRTIYGSTINRYGALVTSFAQTRNIFTINLQHGIFGELGHLPVNADLNLIWGKSDLNYLLQFGVPEDKLRIVGPIFFRSAELLKPSSDNREKRKTDPIKILVALQPLGHQFNKTMISRIEKAAEPFQSKLRILYKLHPDQKNVAEYSRYLMHRNSKLLPHGTIPLSDLMNESDLVMTPFSTVAYEAALSDKFVVFYGIKQELYYLEGELSFVYHVSEIEKLFGEIVKNPSYLSQLKKKVVLKDSHPTFNDRQQLWNIIKNESLKEE